MPKLILFHPVLYKIQAVYNDSIVMLDVGAPKACNMHLQPQC